MGRKIIVLLCCVALCCGFATTAHAKSYTAYEGTLSNTYVTYFKDIVSGIGFKDNYVAFRADQYTYVLIVGKLIYNNGIFALDGDGKEYTIANAGNYNSYYSYNVTDITSFTLDSGDKIVYSDLGDYPQLVERGAKYEMLSAVLICILLLGYVVFGILRKCFS